MVHKGVNFEAQNALKLTYEHVQFQKISGGYTPGPPLKGEGEEREGAREERPPIHIPGYATVYVALAVLSHETARVCADER